MAVYIQYHFYFKILIISILTNCSLLLHSQSFSCNDRAYFVKSNGENSSLLAVTWNDGMPITELLFEDIGLSIDVLGYRTSDQYLYGFSNENFHVYQIQQNGTTLDLGKPEFLDETLTYHAGAITPNGSTFALVGRNTEGTDTKLISIRLYNNPLTAGETAIVSADPVRIEDMAYDPVFGSVLGYDSVSKRLINISYPGGVVTSYNFASLNTYGKMEGVFFDKKGQLFAYGGTSAGTAPNAIFALNKNDGTINEFVNIGSGSEVDACSCPYRMRVEKTINPSLTVPCSEVEVIYVFNCTAGTNYSMLDFLDEFPPTFEITDIELHDGSGIVWSGMETNILGLENTIILLGSDTLRLRINVGEEAGIFASQAEILGFPRALGIPVLSDDIGTLQHLDATEIQVIGESNIFLEDTLRLCPSASLTLFAPENADSYIWSDGSTASTLEVISPDDYWLEITGECGTWRDTITIIEQTIPLEIDLGDDQILPAGAINLITFSSNSETNLHLNWVSEPTNNLDCENCLYPHLLPLKNDVQIQIQAQDEYGCKATDTLLIQVQKDRPVFAPTAFSPNNDGNNDLFFLQAESDAQIVDFQVFNRWGELIFSIENTSLSADEAAWDGQFGGKKVRTGVYLWRANIQYIDGYSQQISGDVTVIR